MIWLLAACSGVSGLDLSGQDGPFPHTPALVARDVMPPAPTEPPDALLREVREGPAAWLAEGRPVWDAWPSPPTERKCAAAREAMSALPSPSPVALQALASCGDPADEARFTAPDTPAEITLAWSIAVHGRARPIPEAAWTALPGAAPDPAAWPTITAFLSVACDTDHPERADVLRELLATAPSDTATMYALRCAHQSDATLRRLHARACGGAPCPPLPDVLLDTDFAVLQGRPWVPGMLARYPHVRTALIGSLARCASDPVAPGSQTCLEALAGTEWPRAQEVASALGPSAEPAVAELQASLARWDSGEAMRAGLRERGVLYPEAEPAITWREPAGRPLTVLEEYGQLVDPGEERTLRRLVVGVLGAIPEVRDVKVREIPAPPDGDSTLQVWLGTTRYQMFVDPTAMLEWTDPSVIAGFLNAAFEGEGLETRVAVPESRPSALVFAPGPALEALHDDGLLRLQDHGDRAD